jgi:alpha-glucosidase
VLGPDFIRSHYAMLDRYPFHWPSIAFSNHDVMRTLTRFGGKNAPPALAQLMLALLLSLRGTVLLYQGEELGLPEADLRRDQLKDPVGDLYYPLHKGRDGCRTPMPWDASRPNLGFSTGTPWLPMSPDHRALAASQQAQDIRSTLSFAKQLIHLRKTSHALRNGYIVIDNATPPILAFARVGSDETILCVFNMSDEPSVYEEAGFKDAKPTEITRGSKLVPRGVELEPYGVWLGRLPGVESG